MADLEVEMLKSISEECKQLETPSYLELTISM